ncbi:hypothetical protein [Candidatus Nanohalococcus occultus]
MEDKAEKLIRYLVATNMAGLLTAIAFYLIEGVITGIIGFIIGLMSSAILIRRKNSRKGSAGILEELHNNKA